MEKVYRVLILLLSLLLLTSCGTKSKVSDIAITPSQAQVSATQAPPSSTPSPSPSVTPTPTATPTAVPSADPIEQRISKMSDKELIGQMVMIGFDGTANMDSSRIELLKDYDIGNIFLFGWNTKTFPQTKKLLQKINSYNPEDIPLLFGVDLEGGVVNRFRGQWKPSLYSARKLGKLNDPKIVHDEYYRIGQQLKNMGIYMDFAPVLDIAHNPSATFLNSRIFGKDPEKVTALISSAIKGLHDAGIASLGKHYPGIGDVSTDPHQALPVLKISKSQADNFYLVPFQSAVQQGIDAMMVTHLSYPEIDDKYITSVSPVFISQILRGDMGFKGVVVSDDLRMKGFTSRYPIDKGAVLFIQAGGDMVFIGKFPNVQKEVCDSIYNAVQDGTLSRERLEESVRRILELKQKYCGLQ